MGDTSAAAVAAAAPPASDNDMPTAPRTGTASFRCFRLETCLLRGMSSPPMPHDFCRPFAIRTPCRFALQDQLRTVLNVAYTELTPCRHRDRLPTRNHHIEFLVG